jgi:hypothetical protein
MYVYKNNPFTGYQIAAQPLCGKCGEMRGYARGNGGYARVINNPQVKTVPRTSLINAFFVSFSE